MSRDRTRQTELAKGLALALGFDRVGVAPARPPAHGAQFEEWIARGFAGEMGYLSRRAAERLDPTLVVAHAKTILCVALRYADRGTALAAPPSEGRVARYAAGLDYHELMQRRLRVLGDALEVLSQRPLRWRCYVDTGPVLEREAAASAGLGWIGKNTCLIDPKIGSYFFLGVLVSDFDLVVDEAQADHCGTCRACLDVCPTGALLDAHVLDATRCLAYTTIELRSEIPEPLRAPQENWVFGCDLCQEVCPWNLRRGADDEPRSPLRESFEPREEWRRPALAWLLDLDEDAWRAVTRKSAMRRAKYRGLLRNALIAAGNSRDIELISRVRAHCASQDPILGEHARWALARLEDTASE